MLVGKTRCLMFLFSFLFAPLIYADYDLVIANGRVIDPETGLDGVRFIGINNGSIEIISTDPIDGSEVIDAKGLVVAPGFIDIHSHTPTFLG
ncbi:MAG: amidohydrolase family protein, partial [Porticoccaceae bacterium]|nr:amidohydrolase family protein [Porticoccaceae bacterium]